MTDKKIGDDILRIPALSLTHNIFWPGNEYEMKINKLPKNPEKSFLKLKTILNERYQEQMEIAIVYLEQANLSVRARNRGVLARITGLSSLKIDASPLVLRVRIMGSCRVLRFFQDEEQDGCSFADIKVSPVLAISKAKWQSDGIKKLKRDIVEDFYEFSIVCAEISEIFSADNEDLKQKFVLFSLFAQKTAISIELCTDFEGLVKSVDEWLEDIYPGSKEILDLKFIFLSLDDEYQQMRMIKEMINNFVGLVEKRLSELKRDSSFFKEDSLLGKKNFLTGKNQLSEKTEREFADLQEELLKRLEEIIKKLNGLKKTLGGEKNDDVR